jgi:shikimate dehydrogenase
MNMDGQTRLLPIIGDPVKQVRAPLVWTGLFSANGVNAVCVLFHVPPPDAAAGRAAALAKRLEGVSIKVGVTSPRAAGYNMLVNATPLGLRPEDPMPCKSALLRPGTIVEDLVMGQAPSRLVTMAQEAGCFAQADTVLMDEQLPAKAQFFRLPSGAYCLDAIAQVTGAGAANQ